MNSKLLGIAAVCLALASVQSIPAVGNLDHADYSVLHLPVELMAQIVGELPLQSRIRVGASNASWKHFADPDNVAAHAFEQHGTNAASQMQSEGVQNYKMYLGLMKLDPAMDAYSLAARFAARTGDVRALLEMQARYGALPISAISGAAESGNTELFKQLRNTHPRDSVIETAVESAAANNQLEFLLKLCESLGGSIPHRFQLVGAEEAAKNGNTDLARAFINGMFGFDNIHNGAVAARAAYGAIDGGHTNDLPHYLASDRFPLRDAEALYRLSAQKSNIEAMKMQDNASNGHRAVYFGGALADAVANDDRNVYEFIRTHRPDWRSQSLEAYSNAIIHDREAYEAELEPADDSEGYAIAIAASTGDIPKVDKYLHRHQSRFGPPSSAAINQALIHAIKNGHWEMALHLLDGFDGLTQATVDRMAVVAAENDHPHAVAKLLKHGLGGLFPQNFEILFGILEMIDDGIPSALLIVSKHTHLMESLLAALAGNTFEIKKALPQAISVAEQEALGEAPVTFLRTLQQQINNQ